MYYQQKMEIKLNNFDELLKNDEIKKISNNAANSFRGVLSSGEIDTCIMNALWKAQTTYDDSKNCKFFTYLHKGVVFECLSQKKSNSSNGYSIDAYNNQSRIQDRYNEFNRIDMQDEIKRCEDPELIYDRFYMNKTIDEIAENRGVCNETIRLKLKKNLKKLKLSLESY